MLKLYRHIYHKNIYLAKNWHIVGGSYTTEFYYATEDIFTALKDANRDGFRNFMHLADKGLTANIVLSKEIEIDGYKGVCKKEVKYPVSEFVLVELVEKGGE